MLSEYQRIPFKNRTRRSPSTINRKKLTKSQARWLLDDTPPHQERSLTEGVLWLIYMLGLVVVLTWANYGGFFK